MANLPWRILPRSGPSVFTSGEPGASGPGDLTGGLADPGELLILDRRPPSSSDPEYSDTMTVANRILLRRCATCDIHYEHGDGGTCINCGRVFCARHLYGRFALLFKRLRGPRPVCRECRSGGEKRPS